MKKTVKRALIERYPEEIDLVLLYSSLRALAYDILNLGWPYTEQDIKDALEAKKAAVDKLAATE